MRKGKLPRLIRSPIIECGGYFFPVAPLMMEILRKEGAIKRKEGDMEVYLFV